MAGPIVNKVAESGILTLEPEQFLPPFRIIGFDIADGLYERVMLKEAVFRDFIRSTQSEVFTGKHVAIYCSEDVIIPTWAWMLAASRLHEAAQIYYGHPQAVWADCCSRYIQDTVHAEAYADKRIVLKGCSDEEVPPSVYMALTQKLQPVARSLMFGEACSTVPVYKKPK